MSNARVDLLEAMSGAGCSRIHYGIESGVDRSLDVFNKRMDRAKNANALKTIEEEEIFVELGFIGFDPFTTKEEFAENVEFLTSYCGESEYIHPFAFDMLLPYRGTPICEFMLKHSKAVEHGLDYRSVISDARIELAWRLTDALLVELGPATEHIKALIIDDNSREAAKRSIRLKNATMIGCLTQIRDAIFRLTADEVVSIQKHPLFELIHSSAAKLNVNLGITQGG